MEASTFGQPVRLNQHHIDPMRDRPRGRSLVNMRVVNRNTLALGLLENTVGPGEHTITVYENETDKILAQVEPEPHKIAEAEKQYELELVDVLKERLGAPYTQGTTAEIQALLRSGRDEQLNAEYRRLLEITPLSPQGVFRRVNKRDILPLVSAEVIPNSVHAEPQREALDQEAKKNAGMFATALREVALEVVAALKGNVAAPGTDLDALVESKVKAMLGEKPAANNQGQPGRK